MLYVVRLEVKEGQAAAEADEGGARKGDRREDTSRREHESRSPRRNGDQSIRIIFTAAT